VHSAAGAGCVRAVALLDDRRVGTHRRRTISRTPSAGHDGGTAAFASDFAVGSDLALAL
jgi:hypothetical protein